MMLMVSSRMAICTSVMFAPKNTWRPCGSTAGNGMYCLPQISMAMFCRMIDTPIAVINGARRGA